MKNLSERLRRYREENSLTQEGLAKLLFVSRQAVSKWEQGKGYPSLAILELLSKLMKISIDELISSEESKVLVLQTNTVVNKSNKKFLISLIAVIMILAALIVVIFSSYKIISGKDLSLNGVVGFYIDIDGDNLNGGFSLDNPNKIDVYYYRKSTQSEYTKNGVFIENAESKVYKNGKGYFYTECEIFMDISKEKQYRIYTVIEDENNNLKAVEWESIPKNNSLIVISDFSLKMNATSSTFKPNAGYSLNIKKDINMWFKRDNDSSRYHYHDTYFESGNLIGNYYNITVNYVDYTDKRLLQYSDENGENLISDISIYKKSATYIDLLPETKLCAIYDIKYADGKESWKLKEKFYNPEFIQGNVYFPNQYGYATDAVNYYVFK